MAPDAVRAGRREHGDSLTILDARPYDLNGQRVYAYRTRTNRALMWFFTACALLILAVPYLAVYSGRGPGGAPPAWPGVLAILAVAGLWWRYRVGQVRTDPWGITFTTLLGPRSIPWREVRSCRLAGTQHSADLCKVIGLDGPPVLLVLHLRVRRVKG